jgi:hypothetical protein
MYDNELIHGRANSQSKVLMLPVTAAWVRNETLGIQEHIPARDKSHQPTHPPPNAPGTMRPSQRS